MNNNLIANARGTRDLVGYDLQVRHYIIDIARECFSKMDAIEMETPAIELKSTVHRLYGCDFNHQVFEIKHGEKSNTESGNVAVVDASNADDCREILRYDLTVPLARYCATNNIKLLRRYQIAKVYRKDNPNPSQARFREFYQCDFDIVGDDMVNGIHDIEILDLLCKTLNKMIGKNTYRIKINHRKLVTDALIKCGIPENGLANAFSIIDKLDKYSWDYVMHDVADTTYTSAFAKFREIWEPISKLTSDTAKLQAMHDYLPHNCECEYLQNLMNMLTQIGCGDVVEFDLTLVRGMDYYTGIIYEAKYIDRQTISTSIAGGGRYDNLIGKLGAHQVPAIGLSIGVERIAEILRKTNFMIPSNDNRINVYVANIGDSIEVYQKKLKICSELREFDFNVIMSNKSNSKMASQLETVFKKFVKYMIVIGENEVKNSQVTVKNIFEKTQQSYSDIGYLEYLV